MQLLKFRLYVSIRPRKGGRILLLSSHIRLTREITFYFFFFRLRIARFIEESSQNLEKRKKQSPRSTDSRGVRKILDTIVKRIRFTNFGLTSDLQKKLTTELLQVSPVRVTFGAGRLHEHIKFAFNTRKKKKLKKSGCLGHIPREEMFKRLHFFFLFYPFPNRM